MPPSNIKGGMSILGGVEEEQVPSGEYCLGYWRCPIAMNLLCTWILSALLRQRLLIWCSHTDSGML